MEKPSIFEVFAQDNLQQAIRPALLHILNLVAKKWPTPKLDYLLDNYTKLYTLLVIILEHYHLKNYGGSFAENFYGLQRVPVAAADGPSGYKLPLSFHVRSLLLLCFAGQLKAWLDDRFEHLQDEEATGRRRSTVALRAFLRVYPLFHALWQGTAIAYQVAFVFGATPYSSPFLHLAGGYLTTLREQEPEEARSATNGSEIDGPRWVRILRAAANGLSYSLSSSLTVGAFLLQYVDWWQSSGTRSSSSSRHVDIPPPSINEKRTIPFHPEKCPICSRNRVKETVLTTSGFVFCYKCVHRYIKENGMCPVTKYPTTLKQLICLYPST